MYVYCWENRDTFLNKLDLFFFRREGRLPVARALPLDTPQGQLRLHAQPQRPPANQCGSTGDGATAASQSQRFRSCRLFLATHDQVRRWLHQRPDLYGREEPPLPARCGAHSTQQSAAGGAGKATPDQVCQRIESSCDR